MSASSPPTSRVLAGFGLAGTPERMPGGQNSSWIVNDTILKQHQPPASFDLIEWQTGVQAQLHDHQRRAARCEFRVAEPLKIKDGAPTRYKYVYEDGWTATRFIQGHEDLDLEARLHEILSASRAMHAILKDSITQPHPTVLSRTDRWAYAEHIAWDELAFTDAPSTNTKMFDQLRPFIEKLESSKRPLDMHEVVRQLVHGDLSGNILFAARDTGAADAPGIIDFTPQWRPVEFAEAIVVADALTWRGGGKDFVEAVGLTELRFQMLVRALLFRILTYTIDVDEDFVRHNLGNMNTDHAMEVVEACRRELQLRGAV